MRLTETVLATFKDASKKLTGYRVPFGILNTHNEQLSIYMGHSAETSDFIVDCLTAWWQENQPHYPNLEE